MDLEAIPLETINGILGIDFLVATGAIINLEDMAISSGRVSS